MDNSQARQDEESRLSRDSPDAEIADLVRGLRLRLARGELSAMRRLRLDNGIVLVNLELTAERLIEEIEGLAALPANERARRYARRRHRQSMETLRRFWQALLELAQ